MVLGNKMEISIVRTGPLEMNGKKWIQRKMDCIDHEKPEISVNIAVFNHGGPD